MARGRWYGQGFSKGPFVPVQREERGTRLPEGLARLAYAEYVEQGHGGLGGQSFERVHARGGFGWAEIAMLLADALERERGGKG